MLLSAVAGAPVIALTMPLAMLPQPCEPSMYDEPIVYPYPLNMPLMALPSPPPAI